MSMLDVFQVAGSALTAQSMRFNAVASNMANAESVVSSDGQPYRAKQVVFEATPMGSAGAMGVRVKQTVNRLLHCAWFTSPRIRPPMLMDMSKCPMSMWSKR